MTRSPTPWATTASTSTTPAGLIPAQFTGNGTFTVTAPQQLGVWKIYLYARDGHGNVGIETRSLRVVAPPVPGTNLARGAATTASTYQADGPGAPYPPQAATDGNTATRWASEWADPQWLQVDLGSRQAFDHVQLVWESAYGKAYEIQVSDDAANWRSVHAHDVRRRRRRRPRRLGHRPLRPGERDAARHRVRLLAVRVRRLPPADTARDQAEEVTFGVGEHDPLGATGLEVRLGGAERLELRDSAFEVADA